MYYFLTQNLLDDEGMADISGHTDITGKYLWTTGQKFKQRIPLQVLELDRSGGKNMPDFFDTTVPVISLKLLDALKNNNINNFDTYPVILKNFITGEEFPNYFAVNFLGSFDAVNKNDSEYEIDSFGDPEYESVSIDDTKIEDYKVFRLETGPDLLVINKEVADYIKNCNLKGLMITETINFNEI